VAIEVALSVVLLVQAVLLTRSLGALQRDQTGFTPESVMSMRIRGMAGGGPALGSQYERYLERVSALPDVAHSAVSSSVLPGRPSTPFKVLGRSETDAARARQSTSYQIVSPDYFDVLGIPLRQGRTFAATDTAASTPVAIVNEEMVRLHWPGENPIGQRILAGSGPREATMTIVGVVGNVRPPFQTSDVPQVYVSYLQQAEPSMFVLVRPKTGRPVMVDLIKRAIWSVEPRQAVFAIRPLDEMLAQAVQGPRIVTTIIGSFAALAAVMSIAGIFAVISYLTSRRLKEIALRRAIGAQTPDVLWLLAGRTFLWTLIGLAAGAGGATLASGAFRAIVPGLLPLDLATVAWTGAGYLIVVAIATILPSLQGLRVDPASMLRAE
jgi:putative ABC transport system permease protein